MQTSAALALMLTLSLPIAAFPQTGARTLAPQDDAADSLRIGVELVQVDVVVTDKNGRRVEGLTAGDFEIFEDGKPQEITNFSFVKGAAPSAPSAQTLLDGPEEHVVRTTLRIDGSDLTFKDAGGGGRVATFDLVAFVQGEGAGIESAVYQTKTLRATPAEAARFAERGLVYVMDLPIKAHGPYQVRAAVRDVETERVGAASEFVIVPDLTRRRLEVSGLGLGGAATDYRPGDEIPYYFAVYNARVPDVDAKPSLTMRVTLWRDGRKVFAGPEAPMSLERQADWRRVNALGGFTLSPKAAPGTYTLQVDVVDRHAPKNRSSATQWVDFEVAPGARPGGPDIPERKTP